MNSKNEPCPLCGGNKTSGETTFTADLGSGVVVVRRVQATVCSQCGEEWIDDATARRLEQVVHEARLKHSEVEVTAFAWFGMGWGRERGLGLRGRISPLSSLPARAGW